jgi:hypothetical protein
MATYIPLGGLKRKESDPEIGSGDDRERDKESTRGGLTRSGQITKEDRDNNLVISGANTEGEGTHLKSVGIFRLAAILFFMGYGGSYGVEGNVLFMLNALNCAIGALSTGPPHYVLISFMVAPFIWALPEALVTGELSSALPNVGGNVSLVIYVSSMT